VKPYADPRPPPSRRQLGELIVHRAAIPPALGPDKGLDGAGEAGAGRGVPDDAADDHQIGST
jgi:hypothetical protein